MWNRRRANRRSGFTVIEMLAASILVALLAVAVLRVSFTLARSRTDAARLARADWPATVVGALRSDLVNAQALRTTPDAVMMRGTGFVDRNTGSAAQKPAEVTYRVETFGGRSWLVRRQTTGSGGVERAVWTELVCPDVSGFSIAWIGAGRGAEGGSEDWGSVPGSVRVLIRSTVEGRPAMDRVVVIR